MNGFYVHSIYDKARGQNVLKFNIYLRRSVKKSTGSINNSNY